MRKAKRQFHAVRGDIVKKQLQAVREEFHTKQHHHPQAEAKAHGHSGGSGVGLKFSEVNRETHGQSHWIDEFEDDGDVSHLLSTNQSYRAGSGSLLSKKPVHPNPPAATNNPSIFEDMFEDEDHFGNSSTDPLSVDGQVSTNQPASHASSSQRKEVNASLFEDGPVLGDTLGSLLGHPKHDPHDFSSSNEYEDLFSESSPSVSSPKQADHFKDHCSKHTLGLISSGEYDSLFSDSTLSSSPVPNNRSQDGHMTTEEVLKPPQGPGLLLGVVGTSNALPSGHEVAEPVVSSATHNSGDETTTEEQKKVHPEVVVEECGDSSADIQQSELLSSTEAQLSVEELISTTTDDNQALSEESTQHQEEERMLGMTRVSLKVPKGPLLASVATSQEGGQVYPSNPVSEEDKSLENSLEFLSHLDDSSASASPLPPQESTVEQERQLAQELSEVEHKESSAVGPSEPNDKPASRFPSSSLDIVIKLPHHAVEPTSSSFVAMSDAFEHPLLGGEMDDSLNDWSLPKSSLPQSSSSSPHEKSHSHTTALEITEDFFSHSPTMVRKEVPTKKAKVGEMPRVSPSSSPRLRSSSQQPLKKSTTRKIVPAVPPRPPHLSSSPRLGRKVNIAERQDSDTVSVTSLTSVVSNDSVFLRETSSVTAGIIVSPGIHPASLTSANEAAPNTTESNVQLSSRTSDGTVDAQDIRSTPFSGRASAKVTVASEIEETYEFDYTLLIVLLSILGLYLYYSLNPFVYLAGFLSGFLMFYLTIGAAFVLYVQYSEREVQRRKEASKEFPTLPKLDELPNTVIVDFESYRGLEVRT